MIDIPIKRDDNGIAHIVAVSGGKDSTAMALRLRELEPNRPYTYICTPTGDELPEVFDHLNNLGLLLGATIWPITGMSLEKCVEQNNAIPNFRMRFCTRQIKIAPFKTFLLKARPCVAYVGLRFDEDEREGADWMDDAITRRFPMREWKWGINDVWQYLCGQKITIPERTDCARCFFQKLGEWWLLWKNHPEIYADAERQEAHYGATWRSPSRDTWPAALKDLRARFEAGDKPEISLRMMETRKMMCRTCSM